MTGRVFITGDKHKAMLPFFGLVERVEIRPTDVFIIAGDTEYVWNEDYESLVGTLQQIFPGTIAFIDGNHDNHDLLASLEEVTWNGGKAHKVGERVFHLMRGEIYDIYGSKYFTMGGARSNDKDRRKEGESWWASEEPDLEEMEYGRQQLMEHLHDIDYVITHEPPLFAREFITRKKPVADDYYFPRILEDWYNLISKGKKFKKWYFGHMHVNQLIKDDLRAIYSDILIIGSEKPVRWA